MTDAAWDGWRVVRWGRRLPDGVPASNDRVVYVKAPFAGVANVLACLGRYTHKSAIANRRLVDFDGEQVRFRWCDYAHGNKVKVMCLGASEFIRRILLHVLPRCFTRLRHYGLIAIRGRARKLAQPEPESREPESPEAVMLRPPGIDITVCRECLAESGRWSCGEQVSRLLLVLHAPIHFRTTELAIAGKQIPRRTASIVLRGRLSSGVQ